MARYELVLGGIKIMTAATLFVCAMHSSGANAVDVKFSRPAHRSITVEYVHPYSEMKYLDGKVYSKGDYGQWDPSSAEANILMYFSALGSGDIDASLKFWAKNSHSFIRKRIDSKPRKEVISAMRQAHSGVWVKFLARVEYGNYLILEIAKGVGAVPEGDKLVTEDYAFIQEDGIWRLTQDLVDDPVFCCRKNPSGRERRLGKPGGDFMKFMQLIESRDGAR